MKIFMIGQKGLPAIFGGVERHVHELSLGLVKAGHEVIVYARKWYSPKNTAEFEGIKIKYLPTIHSKHLDTISHAFLATIHAIKNKADIIHYHGVGPSLFSWLPRIFSPQTKVIVTFHSMDRKHEKWGLFARLILRLGEWTTCRFPHETIAVSKTITQYCRDVYDIEAIFVPNGVPELNKTSTTNELTKWNLESGKYLLAVTRLIPHKGIHLLIEAFKKLTEEKPELMINQKLVIVGDGYYTEKYVEYLKKSAQNNSNIIFTGFKTGEALAELFSHAKLLIHPSNNEGTPINVLEAMSYKLPVLLSDIPEHQELITDKKYLFTHNEVADLTAKLYSLIKEDKEILNIAGLKNKIMVAEDYNWDTIVEKIEQVYRETPKAKIAPVTIN